MAGGYNVDDILAEVNSKRRKARNAETDDFSQKKPMEKEKAQVPFQLAGMTADFIPPVETKEKSLPTKKNENEKSDYNFIEEAPRKKIPINFDEEDANFTLTVDLKRDASGRRIPSEDGSQTKVMPAVKELNDMLQIQRREKVKEFMERSSFEKNEFDFGEEDRSEIKKTFGFSQKATINPNKKKSKKAFKNKNRRNEDDVRAQITEDANDEDEFNSMRDIVDVSDNILSQKRRLKMRTFLNGILFIALFYLGLCNLYPIPLMSAICPENNMKLYILLNLFVLLMSAMVSNSVIGKGLVSFFTFKADNDSPAAVATVAVIAQGAMLAVKENLIYTGEAHLYFAVVGLILFMNSIGKLLTVSRIERNFKIASCGKPLTGEYIVEDDVLAQNLTEGQGLDEPSVAYGKKVMFPSDFIGLSFTDDYFENSGRIITPLFFGFGVLLSLLSYLLFDYSPAQAMTVFAVVICMAAPVTSTLVGALPLWRASKHLSQEGVFVSGYAAVDEFEDVNAVVLDETELYSDKDVILHGIKAFGDGRVDLVIVEAVSLMNKSGGLLKEVFLDVIERKISMIRDVDNLTAYEGGVGGVIDGVPVIMGSAELMKRFGIETPSKDFEAKFLKDNRSLIYLSSGGELAAMIVVTYSPMEDAFHYLKKVKRREPAVVVRTNDPNITAERISRDFNYPQEYVNIIPEKLFKRVDELRAPAERDKAYAMGTGIAHRLRIISALITLKRSIVTATVMQMASLILGYALVALLAFTGHISAMGFLQLMIYQLFWGIAIMLFSGFSRY